MDYLDFEQPIEKLVEKLHQTNLIGDEGEVDVSGTVTELNKSWAFLKALCSYLTPIVKYYFQIILG